MRASIAGSIAAACAAFVVVLPAHSHDHATGVVKERMDLMEAIGKRMKAINTRIKDKQKLAAIKDDARAISASAAHIAHLFPPGSTQQPTDARATIWKDFADFERKAKALEVESAKLADTNPADFAAIRAQARILSQTCSACHEAYRLKQ
jgi:cytochrome c556